MERSGVSGRIFRLLRYAPCAARIKCPARLGTWSDRMTPPLSRRDFLAGSLAASVSIAYGEAPRSENRNVHQQILELAAEQEKKRRARFAAVKSVADLE